MLKKLEIDPKIKIKDTTELIDAPIIIRVNKFTEDSVKSFTDDMNKAHSTGQPIIPIVIDSFGGIVYSLLSMITEIQNAKLPVATICESKAMSAGGILFGFGNENLRFMSPHATLMLHEVSSFTFGKVEDIKADADEIDRLNTHIFELLAKNCKKKSNYFLDLIHEKGHADWFLTAKEAKKHNICNQIHLPELITKVKIEHTFK